MPKFTTRIPTGGSAGNVYAILANAKRLMRQLDCSRAEVDELSRRVTEAGSYAEACDAVREYFPLEGDGDEL